MYVENEMRVKWYFYHRNEANCLVSLINCQDIMRDFIFYRIPITTSIWRIEYRKFNMINM